MALKVKWWIRSVWLYANPLCDFEIEIRGTEEVKKYHIYRNMNREAAIEATSVQHGIMESCLHT